MSRQPLYIAWPSAPLMITRMPFVPASVTVWLLGDSVKVELFCGRSSTLVGSPFLNSMVTRSYPGCVPVRMASTNAVGGVCWGAIFEEAAQIRSEEGVGLGLGEAGAGVALGVLGPGPIDPMGR